MKKILTPTELLRDMRELTLRIGNTTDLDEYKSLVREFQRKFQLLDDALSSGGRFPYQWITKENQYQLSPNETNAPISKTTEYEIIGADEVEESPVTDEQYGEEFKLIAESEAQILATELEQQ